MRDIQVNFNKEQAGQNLRFKNSMLCCLKGLTPQRSDLASYRGQ